MKDPIVIGRRSVGTGQPTYIVAEISANHRQKFEEAVKLVRAAKDVGADAVKVQTFTPDTITLRSDRGPGHPNAGRAPVYGRPLPGLLLRLARFPLDRRPFAPGALPLRRPAAPDGDD